MCATARNGSVPVGGSALAASLILIHRSRHPLAQNARLPRQDRLSQGANTTRVICCRSCVAPRNLVGAEPATRCRADVVAVSCAANRALRHASWAIVRPERNCPHDLGRSGTKRIVALHDTQIPERLSKYLEMTSPDYSDVYGDFEICPLGPALPGHVQPACVASATRLVVQDRERARPPLRLLSTWPKKDEK